MALNITGGELGAYTDLYNNKLAGYATQLNTFAQTLASNANSIVQAGFDQNGNAGTPLFAAAGQTAATSTAVSSTPGGYSSAQVNASNISVLMTATSQLPAALANTAAGTIVQNLNSANNTLDRGRAAEQRGAGESAHGRGHGAPRGDPARDRRQPDRCQRRAGDAQLSIRLDRDHGPDGGQQSQRLHHQLQRGAARGHRVVQHDDADGAVPARSVNDRLPPGLHDHDTAPATGSVLDAVGASNLQDTTAGGVPAIAAGTAGTVTVSPSFFANLQVGDQVVVGADQGNAETATITALGAGPPYTFTANFTNAHAAGESVALVQGSQNAVGTADNSAANALLNQFSAGVALPQVMYQGSQPLVGAAGSIQTLNPPTNNPQAFTGLTAGQTLYLSGLSNATSVPPAPPPGTGLPISTDTATVVGFTATGQLQIKLSGAANSVAGWFFQAAPTQSLSTYYGNLVTQVGTNTPRTRRRRERRRRRI